MNWRLWVIMLANFKFGVLYSISLLEIASSYAHSALLFWMSLTTWIIGGIFYILQISMFLRLSVLNPGYQQKIEKSKFPGQRECAVCGGFQWRGCSHCKKCGRCVAWREWHCSLLGICIARRNFQVYLCWLFLACVTTAVALVLTAAFILDWVLSGLVENFGNLEISSLSVWYLSHSASVLVSFLIPGDSKSWPWLISAAAGTGASIWMLLTWKFLPATFCIFCACAFLLPILGVTAISNYRRGFQNQLVNFLEISSLIFRPTPAVNYDNDWYALQN